VLSVKYMFVVCLVQVVYVNFSTDLHTKISSKIKSLILLLGRYIILIDSAHASVRLAEESVSVLNGDQPLKQPHSL